MASILRRAYPTGWLVECGDSAHAVASVQYNRFDVILSHWDGAVSGPELVALLRAAQRDVPILAMSGDHRREAELLAAGATQFMNLDRWRAVIDVVAEALNVIKVDTGWASASPFPPGEIGRGVIAAAPANGAAQPRE